MSGPENSQSSIPQNIQHYYDRGLEIHRLSGAVGELELFRTKEIIGRYLPQPPALILDVGGGPGIYACWLAQEGYEIHLIDPIPLHAKQARQASQNQPGFSITSASIGDARNLAQADHIADAVLMLGPLYHLTNRDDRIAALREAYRVLKVSAPIFAVGISRFASTLDGLVSGFLDDPDFKSIARRDLADGQHRNPTDKPHYFTAAIFHHPEELEVEVGEAGFQLEKIIPVEGVAALLQDLPERWSDLDRRKQLLETLYWLEDERTILGVTGHLMAVARKR
jgi:ubiquinone/menaquinone biosynthesis C-methylase UbiE